MRKTSAAVVLGAILTASGPVGAVPLWTDTVGKSGSQTHTFNNGNPSYSYTYNIADLTTSQNGTGFMPGVDQVTDAELVLHFKNFDQRDQAELKIGEFTRLLSNLEDARVQLPPDVLALLNGDGTLPVTISLIDGNSFRLEESILSVNGQDRTPVTDGGGTLPGGGGTAGPGSGTGTGGGPAPVPEPGTMVLLGTCLVGAALLRKGKSP